MERKELARDWRTIVVVGFAVSLAACDVLSMGEEFELGTIDDRPEGVFDVPDTVPIGEPFEVRARTVGGCGDRKGTTWFAADDRGAIMMPFDYHARTPCLLEYQAIFEHRATLTFGAPGEARVTLRARDESSGREVDLIETIVIR